MSVGQQYLLATKFDEEGVEIGMEFLPIELEDYSEASVELAKNDYIDANYIRSSDMVVALKLLAIVDEFTLFCESIPSRQALRIHIPTEIIAE